jgi:hypothetical protein
MFIGQTERRQSWRHLHNISNCVKRELAKRRGTIWVSPAHYSLFFYGIIFGGSRVNQQFYDSFGASFSARIRIRNFGYVIFYSVWLTLGMGALAAVETVREQDLDIKFNYNCA